MRAAGVKRSGTCVDGVEIREGARGVVRTWEGVALVANAEIGEWPGARDPCRDGDAGGPFVVRTFGGEFEHNLLLDLGFDRFGHVGDADIIRVGRGVGCLIDGCLVGGRLGGSDLRDGKHVRLGHLACDLGLGLGLFNNLGGVFFREDSALNEFVDEVDGDTL